MSAAARTYQVCIHYREPTYELYAGAKAKPYHWKYSIDAASAAEAKTLALQEFRAIARSSSVSWTRKVVRVDLED